MSTHISVWKATLKARDQTQRESTEQRVDSLSTSQMVGRSTESSQPKLKNSLKRVPSVQQYPSKTQESWLLFKTSVRAVIQPYTFSLNQNASFSQMNPRHGGAGVEHGCNRWTHHSWSVRPSICPLTDHRASVVTGSMCSDGNTANYCTDSCPGYGSGRSTHLQNVNTNHTQTS